jgi:hypothetical protein
VWMIMIGLSIMFNTKKLTKTIYELFFNLS